MKNHVKIKRGLALVMALVMMMALLAGCGTTGKTAETQPSAEATVSNTPKILRIAAAFDFKKASEGKTLVFENLVKSDMAGNFSPWLAESYDVSDDGMVYTFHLRKGITFHDGSAFNAESVKLSLDYLCNTATLGNYVDSVNVIDDSTVELVLGTYHATLLYSLSANSFPMICAADLDPVGDPTGEMTGFIGTGAFYFDESNYEKGVKAGLKRYDDYWDGAAKLDGIEWLMITDPTAMVVALESDEVDVIGIAEHHSSVPYVQIAELKSLGFTVNADKTGRYQVLDYNCAKAPFDDVSVRMAFNLAVNRELMVDTLFEGITTAANTITAPWFVNGPDTVDEDYYKYDFDRATKLLDEAGWVDTDGDGIREKKGTKLELKMVVPTGEANADSVCVYVQSELLKIGAKVEMLTLESSAASDMKKAGDYNMYLHHSSNLPTFPGGILIGGKYYGDGSDTQFTFHSDELNAMIDEAFTNPDAESRSTQIDAIWEYIHAQAPSMPLYSILKLAAFNPRVSGYVVGSNMFDMSNLRLLDMDKSK